MAQSELNLLARAVAEDAAEGPYVARRGDEVLFRLLDIVGRRARGEIPKRGVEPPGAPQAPRSGVGQGAGAARAPQTPAWPARAASGMPKVAVRQPAQDDAKVRAAAAAGGALTLEQAAAAIDAAVVQGRISGTEGMELMGRFRAQGR